MIGSAKIYSSDYGSASTSNSGSPWGSMDGWLPSASQQVVGLQMSPRRPIPPAARGTSCFGDVDRNARTLSDAMEDFKMNGFDSPYDPEENKPWRRLPNNLSGMGPPSSYLRQKSWPEPDRTPAPLLPRFSPQKPVRPTSRCKSPLALQESTRLVSGFQDSARLASGLQGSTSLVSGFQDSARLAPGLQESARLGPGLQDWPEVAQTSVPAVGNWEDLARELSTLSRSAGGQECLALAPLPQWCDAKAASSMTAPPGDAAITAEQLRVLQSLPNVVLYALLRDLQHNRLERRAKKRLPDECRFCKNNGERESYYRSHVLKDAGGLVSCPVLRAFVCRRCGAGGDYAHTIKYCPLSTEEERNQSVAMMRSVRMASGRRRTISVSTSDANFHQADLPTYSGDFYDQWNQPLGPEWAALEQKLLL